MIIRFFPFSLLSQNFFKSVLGSAAKIDIELEGNRPTIDVPVSEDKTEKLPLYIGNENVKGTVSVKLEDGIKKIEHNGIKISLLGVISNNSTDIFAFLTTTRIKYWERIRVPIGG